MCEFLFAAKQNSLYVKKEEDSEGITSYLSKFCVSFFLCFFLCIVTVFFSVHSKKLSLQIMFK